MRREPRVRVTDGDPGAETGLELPRLGRTDLLERPVLRHRRSRPARLRPDAPGHCVGRPRRREDAGREVGLDVGAGRVAQPVGEVECLLLRRYAGATIARPVTLMWRRNRAGRARPRVVGNRYSDLPAPTVGVAAEGCADRLAQRGETAAPVVGELDQQPQREALAGRGRPVASRRRDIDGDGVARGVLRTQCRRMHDVVALADARRVTDGRPSRPHDERVRGGRLVGVRGLDREQQPRRRLLRGTHVVADEDAVAIAPRGDQGLRRGPGDGDVDRSQLAPPSAGVGVERVRALPLLLVLLRPARTRRVAGPMRPQRPGHSSQAASP